MTGYSLCHLWVPSEAAPRCNSEIFSIKVSINTVLPSLMLADYFWVAWFPTELCGSLCTEFLLSNKYLLYCCLSRVDHPAVDFFISCFDT